MLIVAALFIGLRLTIQTCIVDGPSMENTFQNGERILVNKLAYKFNSPQTGDVVIFHPPFSSTAPFIKRIVGLPGERVEILNGTVKIIKPDGSIVTLTEPYIKETPDYNYTSPVINPKEYFGLEIIAITMKILITAGWSRATKSLAKRGYAFGPQNYGGWRIIIINRLRCPARQ